MGLALGTKLSALYFFPMLLFLFIPPFRKTQFVRLLRFFLIALVTYILIGFPQNLLVYRQLVFLKGMSDLTLPATLGSTTEMLSYLFNQMIYLLGAIVVLRIIFHFFEERSSYKIDSAVVIRACVIVLFPIILLVAKKPLFPHEHYTLPFAACVAVLVAFFMYEVTRFLPTKNGRGTAGKAVIIACALASAFFLGLTPNALSHALADQTQGRAEARAVMTEVAKYQKSAKTILVDPYVPYDENLGYVSASFDRSSSDIKPGSADVLVFNRTYFQRFLDDPPTPYVQSAPGWKDTRDFYRLFAGKEKVVDPYGDAWQKAYSSATGCEIWLLQKQ